MGYCSHCGSPNKASSRFCNDCGALLSEPSDIRCAICGSPNKLETIYCITCGGRLEADHPTATGSVDTIVPFPSVPRPVKTSPWQIAEVKEVGMPTTTLPEAPLPSRRMPEWINRIQPSAADNPSLPLPTRLEEDSLVPKWPGDLGPVEDAEPTNGEEISEDSGDWLANLRAAALMELEAARTGAPSSESSSEPPPIPRWFAYIRPPLPRPETGTSKQEQPPVANPPTDVPPELNSAKGSAPKPETPVGLPEWLVQMQSFPGSSDQASSVPVETLSERPTKDARQAEPGEMQGMPEWLREIARDSPAAMLAGTVGAPSVPRSAAPEDERTTAQPELQASPELPLTREEEQGLPDWLVAPIEPKALIPRLDATGSNLTPTVTAPADRVEVEILSAKTSLGSEQTSSSIVTAPREGEASRTQPGEMGQHAKEPQSPTENQIVNGSPIELAPPPAGSYEISALHSRMTKGITEIQGRLQSLMQRLAAARLQSNPDPEEADKSAEMRPEIVRPLPFGENELPKEGRAIEGPNDDRDPAPAVRSDLAQDAQNKEGLVAGGGPSIAEGLSIEDPFASAAGSGEATAVQPRAEAPALEPPPTEPPPV
jgi:Double zinc ribbon